MNRFIALLALWRERSLARQALAQIDARCLRDAAIDPALADFEAAQPFWVAMAPLRDRPAARVAGPPPSAVPFNRVPAPTLT